MESVLAAGDFDGNEVSDLLAGAPDGAQSLVLFSGGDGLSEMKVLRLAE